MLKKISVLALVLVVGVIVAGCSSNNPGNSTNGASSTNQNGAPGGQGRNFNRTAGTAADLTVGKTVMVSGKANPDGSIAAGTIFIGNFNFNRNNSATSTASNTGSSTSGFRRGGPRGSQSNLASGTPRNPGDENEVRVFGEIIAKSSNALTIREMNQTTKNISYSDQTPIYIAQTSANGNSTSTSSTATTTNQ